MRRPSSVVLVAAVLFTVLSLVQVASAEPYPYCQPGKAPSYVLGFKALADGLGETMGEPLECEHAEAETGDAHQQTTRGLGFYRKSTKTATFTNGWEHWALTAQGLVYWTGSSVDPPSPAAGGSPATRTPESISALTATPLPADGPASTEADVVGSTSPSVVQVRTSNGAGSGVSLRAGIVTNEQVVAVPRS